MTTIQVEKKYDNTELKFAMAQLRKAGVVARLNLSVTESDKITDSGKPYLVSLSCTTSNYKKDGIVYLYFDSSNHNSILSIAELLDKSLLKSQMMPEFNVSVEVSSRPLTVKDILALDDLRDLGT